MLYPSIFNESIFDDLMDFDFPVFKGFGDVDKKLYGKHAAQMMKTDVHEHDDKYEVDIDLPGFKKDEITLNLENGYLTVSAAKAVRSAMRSAPIAKDRFPCGSMSTDSTRKPFARRPSPRACAVVDLATPPFWLVIAIVFFMRLPPDCPAPLPDL